MKKELIRSLVAINQATSGATIRRSHRKPQSPRLTTVRSSYMKDTFISKDFSLDQS